MLFTFMMYLFVGRPLKPVCLEEKELFDLIKQGAPLKNESKNLYTDSSFDFLEYDTSISEKVRARERSIITGNGRPYVFEVKA